MKKSAIFAPTTGSSRVIFLFLCTLMTVSCTTRDNFLPEDIYGYKLSEKITGKQAKEMVDKLHFREVGPHKNEIGFYHNESGPLTVYVSRYDDGSEADSGFQNMSGKIMEDQQVFIMGKYLMIRGRRVFRCFGLGQTHFIFTHGRNLIWMSVNTIRAMNIIEAYLNNIG